MDKKYMTYCGLYCGNCAVKVKVEPLALALYEEMKKAGFEEIVHYMPGGDGFWPFLKEMAMGGVCTSCREGRGNPGCAVRICALEKSVETCAFCSEYPCEIFTRYFEGYPILRHDNALLRDEGLEAWAQLQDERQAQGFTYSEEKQTYLQ